MTTEKGSDYLPWIRCWAPGYTAEDQIQKLPRGRKTKDNAKSGKWLIFIHKKNAEKVWGEIKDATENGLLGVGSKIFNPSIPTSRSIVVACIYTYDYEDKVDVYRVLSKLRELGFTGTLSYKTDEATLRGHYGKGVTTYRDPPHPPSYYFKLAYRLMKKENLLVDEALHKARTYKEGN